MEWREFLGEMSLPGRSTIRARYNETRVPFEPTYVVWLKRWSFRRSGRKQTARDFRSICEMLDAQCPGRWTAVGKGIFLFEHRSDAALAKLSWPTELL